jgi:deoxyribose-phosphate aldolase
MDLEKIIKEIVAQVENTVSGNNINNINTPNVVPNVSSGSSFTATAGVSNLYIFCGPALPKSEVDNLIREILPSDPFPKYVAVTPSFINQYGTAYFNQSNITLLNDENYYDVSEILTKVNKVYLPILSLNTASKVGKMVSDNLVTNLILMALLSGKVVEASLKYIVPPSVNLSGFFKDEVERILTRLKYMGMLFKDGYAYNTQKPLPINLVNGSEVNVSSLSSCSQKETGECLSCGLCVEKREDDIRKLIADGVVRISSTSPVKDIPRDLARYIDHTLLKPEATEEQIIKLCNEAKEYGFASVCVNPGYVPLAAKMLMGTPVKVCTVIGFPLGATTTETKAFEAEDAIKKGAQEVDMVINIGWLKSKNYGACEADIKAVVNAAACYNVLVKVIIETALLTNEEKIMACSLAKSAGAHYVKTSTGFAKGGATAEDIALMRSVVGENMGVKASGGVRDTETALKMIESGATRIGASASLAIIGVKGGEKTGY